MADETKDTTTGAAAPVDSTPTTPPAAPDTPASETTGMEWDGDMQSLPPRVREMIRGLNDENAKHRLKAKQAQDAAEKAERARLAETGEYRKLYEKVSGEVEPLRTKADRAEQLEAFVAETVKGQIEALPPQFQPLVPEYDDPLKTLAWLQANAKTLVPPKAPNLDPGQRGTSAPALNSEQQAIAARFKLTPEQFAAARTKPSK